MATKPKTPDATTVKTGSQSALTKLFVLDTNVLMHDPTSLFRFEEHDVYFGIKMLRTDCVLADPMQVEVDEAVRFIAQWATAQ